METLALVIWVLVVFGVAVTFHLVRHRDPGDELPGDEQPIDFIGRWHR